MKAFRQLSERRQNGGSPFDIAKGSPVVWLVPFAYIATAPLASWIAQSNAFSFTLASVLSALGINPSKSIVAYGLLYLLVVYPFSAAWSLYGQTLGPAAVYSNREPRSSLPLLKGLGRRMVSTHQNLMETLPAFCFAAAMVQSLAPSDTYLTNLLGLHVLLKTTLFPLGYFADIDAVRSGSHMTAIGALVAILWELLRQGK